MKMKSAYVATEDSSRNPCLLCGSCEQLFGFPSTPDRPLLRKWCQVVDLKQQDPKIIKSLRICAAHFRFVDLLTVGCAIFLKRDAVPFSCDKVLRESSGVSSPGGSSQEKKRRRAEALEPPICLGIGPNPQPSPSPPVKVTKSSKEETKIKQKTGRALSNPQLQPLKPEWVRKNQTPGSSELSDESLYGKEDADIAAAAKKGRPPAPHYTHTRNRGATHNTARGRGRGAASRGNSRQGFMAFELAGERLFLKSDRKDAVPVWTFFHLDKAHNLGFCQAKGCDWMMRLPPLHMDAESTALAHIRTLHRELYQEFLRVNPPPQIRTFKPREPGDKCCVCGAGEVTLAPFPARSCSSFGLWCRSLSMDPGTLPKAPRLCLGHFDGEALFMYQQKFKCVRPGSVPTRKIPNKRLMLIDRPSLFGMRLAPGNKAAYSKASMSIPDTNVGLVSLLQQEPAPPQLQEQPGPSVVAGQAVTQHQKPSTVPVASPRPPPIQLKTNRPFPFVLAGGLKGKPAPKTAGVLQYRKGVKLSVGECSERNNTAAPIETPSPLPSESQSGETLAQHPPAAQSESPPKSPLVDPNLEREDEDLTPPSKKESESGSECVADPNPANFFSDVVRKPPDSETRVCFGTREKGRCGKEFESGELGGIFVHILRCHQELWDAAVAQLPLPRDAPLISIAIQTTEPIDPSLVFINDAKAFCAVKKDNGERCGYEYNFNNGSRFLRRKAVQFHLLMHHFPLIARALRRHRLTQNINREAADGRFDLLRNFLKAQTTMQLVSHRLEREECAVRLGSGRRCGFVFPKDANDLCPSHLLACHPDILPNLIQNFNWVSAPQSIADL